MVEKVEVKKSDVLVCPICENEYIKKDAYMAHMVEHAKQSEKAHHRYKCPCGCVFDKKSEAETHEYGYKKLESPDMKIIKMVKNQYGKNEISYGERVDLYTYRVHTLNYDRGYLRIMSLEVCIKKVCDIVKAYTFSKSCNSERDNTIANGLQAMSKITKEDTNAEEMKNIYRSEGMEWPFS